MKTRVTKKPKRCLKFEGYIFLPNKKSTKGDLRYHASRTAGRLIVYDEFGHKVDKKDFAFDNLGKMLDHIETIKKKIILKRTK